MAYMNAVNNVVLRAAVAQAKLKDFDMDFDEADEHYDTSKVCVTSVYMSNSLTLI